MQKKVVTRRLFLRWSTLTQHNAFHPRDGAINSSSIQLFALFLHFKEAMTIFSGANRSSVISAISTCAIVEFN